jgi:hypothetical protein
VPRRDIGCPRRGGSWDPSCMEEQEKPSRRHEAEKGTISDSEHADLKRTEDATAQPSDEAEDRNKSPEGGASFDEDDEIAVDPDNAPSANAFIIQITAAMFVVVLLLVLAAVTKSTILLVLALLAILPGVAVVLQGIFRMMSTD